MTSELSSPCEHMRDNGEVKRVLEQQDDPRRLRWTTEMSQVKK